MRKNTLYIVTLILLASCSAPKYSYYFDHYDYNAGKKKLNNEQLSVVKSENPSAEALSQDQAARLGVADSRNEAEMNQTTSVEKEIAAPVEVQKSYKEMTKAEKKEFRKEAKALVKSYIKAKREGDEVKAAEAAKGMDKDLRLAAIFGAVGIVSLLIGGDVFYVLGAIALIIGVVFFVMWLTRQ